MKFTARRNFFTARERTLTTRSYGAPARRLCGEFRTETIFITVNQAMVIAQTTDREIFRLIEADLIHYAESVAGFLLICSALLNIADATSSNFE